MGKSTKKSLSRMERVQLQLQKQQREAALQRTLASHKTFKQSLSGWIKQIRTEKITITSSDGTSLVAIAGLYNQLAKQSERKRTAFTQLLHHLEKQHCLRLLAQEKYLTGLFQAACHAPYFIREISAWKRRSHQPEKQFSHLLRHLFATYFVPAFLDNGWLPGGEANARQWFIDIGRGVSVRKLRALPILLTKRMAHELLHAPVYCTVAGALRYAQVVALGGDEWLAWHLNRTLLGRNAFRHDDFWLPVIRFFVNAPMFDVRRLDEVMDYLNYQRLVQPDFSMKGRTPETLLRQTEAWHAQMNRERNYGGAYTWQSCGISAFDCEEGTGVAVQVYKIRELLSSNELLVEGKAMQHCVYTYVRSCVRDKCAIFSLSVDTVSGMERLATLEVDTKQRRIIQAKARFNEVPTPKALEIIQQWAALEGLRVSKRL